MQDTKVTAIGDVIAVLHNEHGKEIDRREVKNLVLNLGLAHITSRLMDNTATVMSHLGVGTGTTVPAGGDTTLQTEIGTRVAATVSRVNGTSANDTIQYVATFEAGNATGAVTEAGIFNAATNGTGFSRLTFGAFNKGALDSLTFTWQIKFIPV